MPIYKPSELLAFLTQLGISPRKILSQNFLIDGNVIRKILACAQVTEGDLVLEIGPGPGSLTEQLLQAKARVIAVEKDFILAKALERLSPLGALEIHSADIMEFPIEKYVTKKAKVIANLPYHITTPIIAKLVMLQEHFSTLYVMVQEEVARRFVAKPGSKEYSSFTLFLNFFSEPQYCFQVSKHCFFPEPNVQSAVVALHLRKLPSVSSREGFFKMTRTAFSHRRKMLRSSLKELYTPEKLKRVFEEMGLRNEVRPEELTLALWLVLFEKLQEG